MNEDCTRSKFGYLLMGSSCALWIASLIILKAWFVNIEMMFMIIVISAIAEAGLRGEDLPKDFFREEYMLNYTIGEIVTLTI